ERAPGLAPNVGGRIGGPRQQGAAPPGRLVVPPRQRPRTDAPARRPDGPPGCPLRGRGDHPPEGGQRVPYPPPLGETHAPDDDVGYAGAAQGVFEDPRLGVGPIEDGDPVPRQPLAPVAQNALRDERGLVVLVPGAIHARRLAGGILRPQRLVLALRV